MENDNRRELLIDIIKREFIGPDIVDMEGMIQENGEEILSSDPPRIRYSAGILFPHGVLPSSADTVEEAEVDDSAISDLHTEETLEDGEERRGGIFELMADTEEMLNLSNAYHQSAISLTAVVRPTQKVRVSVSAGTYGKVTILDPVTEKKTQKYPRSALAWDNDNQPIEMPTKLARFKEYMVVNDGKETNMRFAVSYRYEDTKNNCSIYTFTLRNAKEICAEDSIRDEDCYFQVGFVLRSEEGFAFLPDSQKININDEDYQSNQLLYRNVKSYAIGHGCSADWCEDSGKVTEIFTEIFPSYETKPIVPSAISGVSLEMYKMSDLGNFEETIEELEALCEKYREWNDGLKQKSLALDDNYRDTAERHIRNCDNCYRRMYEGVALLKQDAKVRKAFQYMNRAMLLQQVHYNLPLQGWEDDGHGDIRLVEKFEIMPDINDSDTWYGNIERYGKWRPFQLAFILINLKSMAIKNCAERKNVDLIWFPTGGGKTEAYLGLSAYTIFIRKLNNLQDSGTAILMRYTLRLLTAQQYERAAAMICACELIRKEKGSELGSSRITIGLWVGGETTPNKMAEAVKNYEHLYNGKTEENPFIMLKCPWCGAQMGVVSMKNRNEKRTPGYRKTSGRHKEIVFQCRNEKCDFSADSYNLPLLVIDEAIYNNPPTLLLGTVDKFAMLPFRPEAQRLFGIYPNGRGTPPDLIIQDELHLISGPLGSMVGHYETMISELCMDRRGGQEISPKVIASTATISRAKEQCNALYNCGKDRVVQFPPSGIDVGDSFFAVEDKDRAGRKYVGILSAGSSSYAMTTIRLYAALLYAAKALKVDTEEERDPYWTNVGYFNSLRELGQAATWVSADIDEYLHTIYKRRYEDKQKGYKDRRYIWRYEELTSRIRSDKIPMSLQNLGIRYPTKDGEKRPVDICLATNMISVGVDVSRLGMMTVTGQPKTTAEYIQATSRVGRDTHAPGIIFTTYHPGKPRDKSYYEHFRIYHSRVYCHVEPTSVTPFSSPLRERALHAILIGLIRLLGNADTYNDPKRFPNQDELDRLFKVIKDRVCSIDKDELENTSRHLDEIMTEWRNQLPQKYQDFNAESTVPLMYPAGTMPNIEWDGRGIATPTSMRSVDASCEAYVLNSSYTLEED